MQLIIPKTMFLAKFKKSERKLIKKIAKLQLAAFKAILENETEQDVTLICLQQGLDEKEVKQKVLLNQTLYKRLEEDPNILFTMDEDNLDIIRHLMSKYFKKPKYQEGRADLWYKLNFIEDYMIVSPKMN